MTLNIIFFTITIKKRTITLEEALQEQRIEAQYQQTKDRISTLQRMY